MASQKARAADPGPSPFSGPAREGLLEARHDSTPQPAMASSLLLIAVPICCVSPLLFGFALSFTSPTEGSMTGGHKEGVAPPDDLVVFSKGTESWYGSLFNIGAIAGAFAGSPLSNRFGRRRALALSTLPHLVAWLCTFFSRSSALLIGLRTICGFGVGIGSAVAPCYIGEVATDGLRGALGAANQLSITLGIFAVSVLGSYGFVLERDGQTFSDWPRLSLVGLVLAIVLLFILFMPESPKWLAAKGDVQAAEQALRKLRSGDVSEELKELLDQASCSSSTSGNRSSVTGDASSANCANASLGDYKRSLLVGIGLLSFQQVSGANAIMMYTTEICKQAKMPNAELMAIVSMGLQMLVSAVACGLMERAGRRPLLLVAAASMAASHLLLSYYYLAQDLGLWGPPWLALLALATFLVGFSLGLGPIPWLIQAEIFPAEVRGTASSIATAVNWSFSFLVTLLFQPLEDAVSPQGAFLFFGIVCVGCFFFTLVLVPETKGKSVQQVVEELSADGSICRRRRVASARDVPLRGAAVVAP